MVLKLSESPHACWLPGLNSRNQGGKSQCPHFRTFSDLESILLGLDLAEYLPLFRSHKVTSLDTFLCLSEADLEAMGVAEVGARKKIADGIFSIHKKP